MRKALIMALTFGPLSIFAQSAERQVIASTGGTASAANVQISYTVGETVIAAGSASNIIITQGFQQSDMEVVGMEELNNGLSVNVYPNPATDNVTIDIETTSPLNINATVYDLPGKQTGIALPNLNVNGRLKQTLDLSSLASGQYFISFTDKNTILGTVRIQKVN